MALISLPVYRKGVGMGKIIYSNIAFFGSRLNNQRIRGEAIDFHTINLGTS